MFKRYSERARRVVFYARFWASQRGSDEIDPRDLFLGATHDKHQAGCPFEKLHDEAEKIRELLVPGYPSGFTLEASGASPGRELPLSITGKTALAYAAQEAEIVMGGIRLAATILCGGSFGRQIKSQGN